MYLQYFDASVVLPLIVKNHLTIPALDAEEYNIFSTRKTVIAQVAMYRILRDNYTWRNGKGETVVYVIKHKLKVWDEILFSPAEFSRSEANGCDDVSIQPAKRILAVLLRMNQCFLFYSMHTVHAARFPIKK